MDGVVELNCAGCILVPAKKIPCVGNKKKKSQQEGDRTELIVCCKHSNPLLVNARDLRHVSERMFSMPCAAVHHLSQSIFFIYYFMEWRKSETAWSTVLCSITVVLVLL